MRALKKEMKQWPNIRLIQDLLVVQLLTERGRAVGAIALDIRSGELKAFSARAVVLATGGNEELWGFSDTGPDAIGDGPALALAAGAELMDMELTLFYPTVVLYPDYVRGVILVYDHFLHPDQAAGKLVNAQGKEFLGERAMPLRDELVRAMATEISQGRATERGGLLLDLTRSSKPKEEVAAWAKKSGAYPFLKEMGVDLLSQPLEVAPATHFSLGGVRINERAETNIPGLYAAGECAANLHGANRISGNALAETIIFGAVAGENAIAFARKAAPAKIDRYQLDEVKGRLSSLGQKKREKISPHRLKKEIKKIMDQYVGLNRTEAGLTRALTDIKTLARHSLPCLSVVGPPAFNLSLAEALEAELMVMVAEVVTQSALVRQETRGHHFRSDFPQPDNAAWLKHTIARKEGEKIVISAAPVICTRLPLPRESSA